MASLRGVPYASHYAASKHGLLGLMRSLAAEYAKTNLTVNAVCPGYVDTPMTDQSVQNIIARTGMTPEKARTALENTSPQRRLIEPEEVAAMTVYLALDISKGITGQAINIDGGGLMS